MKRFMFRAVSKSSAFWHSALPTFLAQAVQSRKFATKCLCHGITHHQIFHFLYESLLHVTCYCPIELLLPTLLYLNFIFREVKLITSDGTFDVDISLFRDSLYQQIITPKISDFFVSLAEGEVVFVSVDLKSKNFLSSDDAVIVMDTCFVTSHINNKEPLMYLIQDRFGS